MMVTPRLAARGSVSHVSVLCRHVRCRSPGLVFAMREASQTSSRGTHSVPVCVTPSTHGAVFLLGGRDPGPVVNEPDWGSFGVLISQNGADVRSAPNSGARADISGSPLRAKMRLL
jgi:hypothetical protein